MINSTLIPQKQASLNHYLLKKSDYLLVRSQTNKYLFLSETLQYFQIADPSIEEYIKLCNKGNINQTFLDKEKIMAIGNYLATPKKENNEKQQDIKHNFLILNLTGACNLCCKYCFAEIKKKHNTMTFDIAKKAIDHMINQQSEEKEYFLYFFGGEPLLKKHLIKEITEYAFEEITERKKKKINFLINTNATLIDDEIVLFYRQYNFKVTVSIDGPADYHNKNRVYKNSSGSFNNVMKGINLLKTNKITTDLRATFSPDTQDLISLFNFFEELKLPYTYSFTINSEYKLNLKETLFKENQFEIIDKELHKVMDFFFEKIKNKEIIHYTGLNQKLLKIKHKFKSTHACEAGRKSITIDENGNYYACQNMIPYKHTILGNIHTGISNEKKKHFRSKELKSLIECNNCSIRNLCGGGCEVERNNSNPKAKLQMCKLFHLEWKNLLYLYALIIEAKKMYRAI